MSLFGTTSQPSYPDEFGDSMADLTARIVQEQLTPILETLREHAKLLDLHAALLNHNAVMNRYNVGKLDDIRDFQANINYKLQFYVDPEERTYPTYNNPPAPVPLPRVEAIPNMVSLPPESAPDPSDEPTESDSSADESRDDPPATVTTTTRVPESQAPPSSPTTERAPSPPPSPQFTGEAFAVIPSSSRQLQRERPFAIQPDPMWNSTRAINPFLHLAAPPPPPPYVEPPAYTTEDPSPPAAESQATTLAAEHTSPPPSVPPPASEAEVEEAVSAGPSASDTAENTPRTPSPSPSPVATISTARSFGLPEGEDDPDAGTSTRLSEKARGKKRMREEDLSSSSDEDESDENDDLFVASSSSGSGSRHDRSDSKRKKTVTRIDTDRLDLSPCGWLTQRTSFMDKLYTLSDRRRNAEKLKSMQRLYRSAQ